MSDTASSPSSLSRNLVLLILGAVAILAFAAVTIIAINNRNSPFKVYVQNGEQRIGFEFSQNVSLSEMLDKLLTQQAEEGNTDLETQVRLINSVLLSHDYYLIPSDEALDEIRRVSDGDTGERAQTFIAGIRNTLYNLEGPFSPPGTLSGITHARLLDAFDELHRKDKNNPLLESIWEGIVGSERDFLKLRAVENVQAKLDSDLNEGIAKTCSGSFLLGKAAIVTSVEAGTGATSGSSPIQVYINERMLCPNGHAPSGRDLIHGKGTTINLSLKDMQQLQGSDRPTQTLQVTLVPAAGF